MKFKSLLVSILFLVVGLNLKAQPQTSSFVPQNLGSEINSEYDELNPVVSPDGKTIYFVRSNHPENKYGEFDSQDIWCSELINGSWTRAQRIPELNIGRYNAILSLTDEGKTVLLNGVYNKKGTFWKRRGLSFSFLQDDGSWAPPKALKIKKLKKINDGSVGGASMNQKGDVILLSVNKFYNSDKADIFVTTKKENGKWTRPKKIHLLSSNHTEVAPFLSADDKTVFLASDGAEKGKFEIYTSTRLDEDWFDWSSPKKLSDTINSNQLESFFKTNESGSWAYFSSNKKSNGGVDIYKVKMFEEFPFVVVYGRVLNGNTKAPINKDYAIKVNGLEPDSVVINRDSSTYKVVLPLKKKYSASAITENYISTTEVIDVSNVREFTKVNKDLVVTPLPYVQVTGRVLDRNTEQPVSASFNPHVFVDGLEPDSLQFDSRTSTYVIKLNHGKFYSLQAKASRYESKPANLDLLAVNEYQEINFNLYVETEKMVTVKGLVTGKKSGTKFEPASKVQIVFVGQTSVVAPIDTTTAQYEIYLQPGVNYAITVTAPDCLPTYEAINLSGVSRGSTITKNLVLAKVEVGEAVRLNNIFFESGHSALKKESFPELDKVYEFLSQNPSLKIEISGHTDNTGNAAFNMMLSGNRAKAVASYLTKKGIAVERLQSKGYGITKPVASNATNAGRAQNRRVEFVILGK